MALLHTCYTKFIQMENLAAPRPFVLFGGEAELDEQRGVPRFNTKCVVLVRNLTSQTQTTMGLLHDVCVTGMRVQTRSPVHVGDELRVDLPGFMILAEVVHYAVGVHRHDAGLKLARQLTSGELQQCIQPRGWAKILLPENCRTRVTSFDCR